MLIETQSIYTLAYSWRKGIPSRGGVGLTWSNPMKRIGRTILSLARRPSDLARLSFSAMFESVESSPVGAIGGSSCPSSPSGDERLTEPGRT